MFKFAKRIIASIHEVDAVTYKQFMEWEQKDKDQYLKDHPKSSFRHKINKKQPSAPKRTDEEFMYEWNKDNRRSEET